MSEEERAACSGGCLCGAVRYEVKGQLGDVINCHCSKCRRFHGHSAAYTSSLREELVMEEEGGLKWFRSMTDETPGVRRGFCGECGASMFWDAPGEDRMYISAGSVDKPTGLKTVVHIWVSQAGDYYEITDDLERHSDFLSGPLAE